MPRNNISNSIFSNDEVHQWKILEALAVPTKTKIRIDFEFSVYPLSYIAGTNYTRTKPLLEKMLDQGLIYEDGTTFHHYPRYNITEKGLHVYRLYCKERELFNTSE